MLLGYNKQGEIKFIFTDEKYLEKKYPNNTAKISNFWGNVEHGLIEFFIPIHIFKDWDNSKNYKIVNGKITKKDDPIKVPLGPLSTEVKTVINKNVKKTSDTIGIESNNSK